MADRAGVAVDRAEDLAVGYRLRPVLEVGTDDDTTQLAPPHSSPVAGPDHSSPVAMPAPSHPRTTHTGGTDHDAQIVGQVVALGAFGFELDRGRMAGTDGTR